MTIEALSIAASGMAYQNAALEVVTQSLANMETPGFKEEMMVGATLDYSQEVAPGSISASNGAVIPAGIQKGQGVKAMAVLNKALQGKPIKTGIETNILIQGKGYFQVEMPDGTIAYTRDGTFTKSPDGTLITQSGFTVIPAVTVPEGTLAITINQSGQVFATTGGNAVPQNIGQIELANFRNEDGLRKADNNLSFETEASGAPIVGRPGVTGVGTVLQGYYEGSNADPVRGVTQLIVTQRAFELQAKGIKTAEEMMGKLATLGS